MINKRIVRITEPLVDDREWDALKGPIYSGWLTQGPKVADFERCFAEKHGVDFAVATTNCTTALHIALVAMGIGRGDEVIVPAFTWVATVNVVEYVGAKPVFCDVDRKTFNIDTSQIENLISLKTRAIIPVHLFGLCADMDPIFEICKQREIKIIEDAACASGASYKGRMAGSLGEIGCFSFHPRKIITTGEGGMCTTNNKELAESMICLRNHGASVSEEKRHSGDKPYLLPDFNVRGFNYRMTDLQGSIGLVQLDRLSFLIAERRKRANWYRDKLGDLAWLQTPIVPDGYGHSYQSFVCYVDEEKAPCSRDNLMEILHQSGIAARPGSHAVHMLGYYSKKYRIHPDDYPGARDCYKYSLAIPLHNKMTEEDFNYVVDVLKGLN